MNFEQENIATQKMVDLSLKVKEEVFKETEGNTRDVVAVLELSAKLSFPHCHIKLLIEAF